MPWARHDSKNILGSACPYFVINPVYICDQLQDQDFKDKKNLIMT